MAASGSAIAALVAAADAIATATATIAAAAAIKQTLSQQIVVNTLCIHDIILCAIFAVGANYILIYI